MCGIAGIFAYANSAAPIDIHELAQIRDHMASRGPDGIGEWISEYCRVGLAHRRLSIIDLSDRASQPMQSADGALVVTFNGEIYNHQELREELALEGCACRTRSDTELLLHLYRRDGAAMVRRLRGMFAFAIWDEANRRLFLARDPYGIKPLYYAVQGGTFRFASQARAILAGGAVSEAPDPAGWVGFYLHGSVQEPFTSFRAIQALPAGATLIVDSSGPQKPTSFFSIAAMYAESEQGTPAMMESGALREALLDSVRHHLIADVPIGCFLSAGVDSCALLALMRETTSAPIKAVTLAFQEFKGSRNDEAPLAALAAEAFSAEHVVRVVDRAEFHADLGGIVAAMDQPSIDGLNSYFVSKAAREIGLKVAISGLGGDELFGGYPSFTDIPNWVSVCAPLSRVPWLGAAAHATIAAAQRVTPWGSPKMPGMIKYAGTFAGAYLLRRGLFMPWELDTFLDRSFVDEGMARLSPLSRIEETQQPFPHSSFARVASLEAQLYMRNQLLRDADWASMAHSVEVRVPLVDHVLLSKVTCIRPHPLKENLARAPLRQLPSQITHRKKSGFSTPIGAWLDEASKDTRGALEGQTSRRWAHALVNRWPKTNAPALKTRRHANLIL